MKRFCLGLTTACAICAAGIFPAHAGELPFGFDIDKHPENYAFCEDSGGKVYGNVWRSTSPPRPHPWLQIYELEYMKGIGICAITGEANFSGSDESDMRLKIKRMHDQPAVKYGKGRQLGGSNFWAYQWTTKFGFWGVGNVRAIQLIGSVSRKGATVNFFLSTYSECVKKVEWTREMEEGIKAF